MTETPKSWEYDSYEEYVKCQIRRHQDKFYYHSPQEYYEEVFSKYKEYVNNNDFPEIKTIIAHGVRNDYEIDVLNDEFPNAEVCGTDINYQNKEKNIFKVDFNNCPKEWESKFDLLFSNSFDHSPEAEKTLKEWKRITKKHMLIHFQHIVEGSWHDPLSLVSSSDVTSLCDKLNLEILFLHETESGTAFQHPGWLVLIKV